MELRNTIRRITLLSAVTIAALCIGSAYSFPPKAKRAGSVAGVVFDVNDARVVGAAVTIKARNFSEQVKTGEAGEFQADLPVGEYYFTVAANGFCRFEGEHLRVRAKTTEIVNIHLEVAVYDSPDGCKCSSRPRKK